MGAAPVLPGGFWSALAGALLVAAAFEADPRLGGGVLLLVVFAQLSSAQRAGILAKA